MIKSLALTNFKSIGKTLIVDDDRIHEGKLDFAPLTIFCGKNSSGKSTVLQSILLLAQTLQSNVPSQTLVLNGPMVKLGSIDDIKTDFYAFKNIEINIDILTTEVINGINEIDASFNRRRSNTGPEEQLGYYEKTIFLEEVKHLFVYSFSKTFDGIKEAVFERTGFNLTLKKAKWKINSAISKTIKDFMIANQVDYSMTTWHEGGISNIIVNKRTGNEWFIIRFAGINGKFLSKPGKKTSIDPSELSPADMQNFSNKIKRLNSTFISFDKKPQKNVLYEVPAITKIKLQSTYLINNGMWVSAFFVTQNKKPSKITAKHYDFEYYNFQHDKYVKNLLKDNLIENRQIGLKLNHFLPEKIIYVTSQAKRDAKILFDSIFKQLLGKKYSYNEKSTSSFNESIATMFGIINEYEASINKKATIFNPPDISVKDEVSFAYYVKETKSQLEGINIIVLLTETISFLYNKYNIKNKLNPDLDEDYKFPDSLLVGNLGCTLEDRIKNINDYFKNKIRYIGPLREEPHLQYDPYIESSTSIGIKGENSAGVLFNSKNMVLKFINPHYFDQKGEIVIKNFYFFDIVNEWIRYIGVADSVDIVFNGRYGYELKINSLTKNTRNDLTNVGVGVSQVLPIVLACLLAPEESTIIIEQPELHLHPAMQSKITDFFVATILCNKQVIIETHSEHIVNSLRLRTVKNPTAKSINDQIKIYFTENLNEDIDDYKKGNTVFRPLEINEYAAMSDWPEGFFDESSKTADEIIKAVSEKWSEDNEQ